MKIHEFGNPQADTVLIQMADGHDLSLMDGEILAIRETADADFRLLALEVDSWNDCLSPWKAPAVFGREGFGGGAEETLGEVLRIAGESGKALCIGGYSLAGLFALWASYRTNAFCGVAAASPSLWYPGFSEYMRANGIRAQRVYLSLGDKEEKTRNPVMRTVGDRIREAYEWLNGAGVECTLEWNSGNHFADPAGRTAKAFAWNLRRMGSRGIG